MDVCTVDTPVEYWSGDSLVLGLFSDELDGLPFPEVDRGLAGAVATLLADGFAGQPGEVAGLRLGPGLPVGNLVAVGLGNRAAVRLDDLRRAAALGVRWVKRGRSRSMGVALPAWRGDPAATAEAVAEGVELALHEGQWAILDDSFKQPDGLDLPPVLARLELLGLGDQGRALDRSRKLSQGVVLSRELAAAPPNVVGPEELAAWAARLAAAHGLELLALDREACAARRMGGFLGAARASVAEPRFLHLRYRPPGVPERRLAIVGLGLTFDPRGLDRGPERRIEAMKKTMGGAASALGAAEAVARIGSPDEVHFLVPAAEGGLLGGGGIRPGDLCRFADGRTVEVNEVDAEGRMMVAEALLYARGLGVDAIVDLATLSPACVAALGEEIAGLWATDDRLADAVERAAERAGEPVWRLPLADRYDGLLWAPFANFRTTGPPAGEAITTALFLRRFADSTPWAHLDISGPVWSKRVNGYYNAGATGFGVGTLVNWICHA